MLDLITLFAPSKDPLHKNGDYWRPTFDLVKSLLESTHVTPKIPLRVHLIYQKKHNNAKNKNPANILVKELATTFPIEVKTYEVDYINPHDILEISEKLTPHIRDIKQKSNKLLIHTSTGTGAMQRVLQHLLNEWKVVSEIQSWPKTSDSPNFTIIESRLQLPEEIQFTPEIAFSIDALVELLDSQKSAILLMGESGVGKSYTAKKLAEILQQNTGGSPLVETNCAYFGDLARSELFGYVEGAFTGAAKGGKKGILETVDGGILFLDEIAELDLSIQAMLLKTLDDYSILPIGAQEYKQITPFKLICGTNKDLFNEVEKGTFREDLLYRISLAHYTIPPLRNNRNRKEWEEKVISILENLKSDDLSSSKKVGVEFSHDAFTKYLSFATSDEALWKANYRDLRDSLKRLVLFSDGVAITELNVLTEIKTLKNRWYRQSSDCGALPRVNTYLPDAHELYDYIELVQIEECLKICEESTTMAEAGKRIFNKQSDKKRNFSDLLKKKLSAFNTSFEHIKNTQKGFQ